jgi:DNA polymerase (family 10)
MKKTNDPKPYARVLAVANTLVRGLKEQGIRVAVCGSLRRGRPFCDRVDLVVSPPLTKTVKTIEDMAGGVILPGPQPIKVMIEVTKQKHCHLTVITTPVYLYVADDKSWGAMVMSRTGNWRFNRVIRGIAKDFGYKLNDEGMWFNDERIAGRTESQIFEVLGLEYLTPEERELTATDRGKLRRV